MKRILRKYWDEANGRLTVNYWRVYKNETGEYSTARLTRFVSPLFLKSPEDAKGKMYKAIQHTDLWFSLNQVREITNVFEEANN